MKNRLTIPLSSFNVNELTAHKILHKKKVSHEIISPSSSLDYALISLVDYSINLSLFHDISSNSVEGDREKIFKRINISKDLMNRYDSNLSCLNIDFDDLDDENENEQKNETRENQHVESKSFLESSVENIILSRNDSSSNIESLPTHIDKSRDKDMKTSEILSKSSHDLIIQVLNRCGYFLASKILSDQITVLETMLKCFLMLNSYHVKYLYPSVHDSWSALMCRLHELKGLYVSFVTRDLRNHSRSDRVVLCTYKHTYSC